MFGVSAKLLIEIENMTVRISFAEYGDEAEDVRLHTEPFAIRGDEPFGGEFGCGVERGLDGKRSVFGRGKDLRLAVDGTGGRKSNALYAAFAHGFENIGSGNRVLFEILARVVRAEANVGIGGHVEDEVHAFAGSIDRGGVEEIA